MVEDLDGEKGGKNRMVIKERNAIEKRKEIHIVLLLFIIDILFHFILGNFVKSMKTYPDELLYLSLAECFHDGVPLSVHGIPASFHKIGYSLFLIPVFSIESGLVRVGIINLINSLLISSSIIPTWLIGKELNLSGKRKVILCFFVMIWPETVVSAAVVSEVLYWPCFLLFVYLAIRFWRKQTFALSALMGIVGYLGYLTKEIFLALIAAFFMTEVVHDLHIIIRSKKKTEIRTGLKRLIFLVIFSGTFLLIHLVLEAVFFPSGGNSYELPAVDSQMGASQILYMVYAYLYYLAALVMALLVVPVVCIFWCKKTLPESARKTQQFITIFFLVLVAVVVCMITSNEDPGSLNIRIHFRYFAPGFIVVLGLFLSISPAKMHENVARISSFRRGLIIVSIVSLVLLGVGGVRVVSLIDGQSLEWYRRSVEVLPHVKISEGSDISLSIGAILNTILLAGYIALLCYLMMKSPKGFQRITKIHAVFLAIACGLNMISGGLMIRKNMFAEREMINEVIRINDYIEEQGKEGTWVYLTDEETVNEYSGCLDTYLDRRDELYFADMAAVSDLDGEDAIPVRDIEWKEWLYKTSYPKVERVDYFIVDKRFPHDEYDLKNTEMVDNLCGDYYAVYRNLAPEWIGLE